MLDPPICEPFHHECFYVMANQESSRNAVAPKDLWIEKTLTFPYLSSLTTYKKMKMRIEIRIEMRMRVREG